MVKNSPTALSVHRSLESVGNGELNSISLADKFEKNEIVIILGIDGSDDVRATMYHLMIKTNRNYLEDFFVKRIRRTFPVVRSYC